MKLSVAFRRAIPLLCKICVAAYDGVCYQNAFEKLLKDVNEKRRADMAREESFDGFEAYLQHHRGEVEITQAEIDSLKNLNNPGKAVLTRAEALEDVDLFFPRAALLLRRLLLFR